MTKRTTIVTRFSCTPNSYPLCCLALLTALSANAWAQPEESATLSLVTAAHRGPAVASVLEMPRETPAQQLSAIFTLLDLGETDVAQTLWKNFSGDALAGDALEDDAKAALVHKFGAARFLNLARRNEANGLAGARSFAESCLQASAHRNSDPKRLTKLIGDLSNESAEIRRVARSDLAVSGDPGAVACLEALAKATDEKLRTELMLSLTKQRPGVEPMLIAALADGRGHFRRDVVELAGYLHLQNAVPWLAAIAAGGDSDPTIVTAAYAALAKMGLSSPSAEEARALIRNEIWRVETLPVQNGGLANWWSWHHTTPPIAIPGPGKLVSHQYPVATINKLANYRLASVLNAIGEPSEDDRQTMMIYWMETTDMRGAEDLDWDNYSTQILSETLENSLQGDHLAAATICAAHLGRRADAAALQSMGGKRSALATALAHADQGLRFAALEAIMKIAPQQSFAGASGVPQALWHFAAGAGTPQAIAASSVFTRASDWAGQLRGLGYDATPVATGREALRSALASPRLELILVDSDINHPLVREVIYQLRSTPQTALMPIAVLSSLHNLPRARKIADQDPWLLAIPRPHDDAKMQAVVARLGELGPKRRTAERRSEQAAAALGWIADLLETGHPYDELLRNSKRVGQTLYSPELSAASLRLLAVLGTADSQRLLLDYLSAGTLPIEARRSAGGALGKSVERFGKLLTSAELLRQYDRYNASETAAPDTQDVLGKVLDLLEK